MKRVTIDQEEELSRNLGAFGFRLYTPRRGHYSTWPQPHYEAPIGYAIVGMDDGQSWFAGTFGEVSAYYRALRDDRTRGVEEMLARAPD